MVRALTAVLLCGLAAAAHAEPRADPTVGRAVFTGATSPNATSLELDPAALALGKDTERLNELYFAATAVFDRYAIQRRYLDLDSGAQTPGPSLHDTEMSPGFNATGVYHIAHDVTVALSVRSLPVEMFPTGNPALQYHTLGERERISYAITFGGGVKLTDELLFGVSLSAQSRHLHLRYARDTALEHGHGPAGVDSDCGGAPCGIENPLAAEVYDLDVQSEFLSTDALAANIGLLYVLGKDMYVALGYHAAPGLAVQNTLTGTMNVTRAPRDGGGIVHGDAAVVIQEPASVDAEFRMRLPDELDLHVGFRWEDLSRMSAYDVRGFGSTLPAAGIPEWTERARGFHDPFALWAGVEQAGISDTLRVGARLGIETSSVDTSTTSPMAIDPFSVTADLGAQVRLTSNIILQATYGLQYFAKVEVRNSAFDPRARIECVDSGYDYSTAACGSVRTGYAIATADGDYQRVEHALRLALRFRL